MFFIFVFYNEGKSSLSDGLIFGKPIGPQIQ